MKRHILAYATKILLSSTLFIFVGCGEGDSDSNSATTNHAPIFTSNATASPQENQLSVISLVASDADNDTITYSISGTDSSFFSVNSISGELTFNSAPDFENPSDLGQNNVYNIIASANDSHTITTQNIIITVTDVNEAGSSSTNNDPVATFISMSVVKNSTNNTRTLTATDADGDTLTFSMLTNPSHGTLTLSPTTGAISYTPTSGFSGTDSFTYKVNDGTINSALQTVTITVNNANTNVNNVAPVATSTSFYVREDATLSYSLTGTDADGDNLSYSQGSAPTKGTLNLSSNGAFTYTPNANYNGSDTFSYFVNDGALNSPTVVVTVTVDSVNDAPVTVSSGFALNEDTQYSGTLVATDIDRNSLLAFSVVTNPSHGTLTLNRIGATTYVPTTNFSGTDSFSYKVNDGALDSPTRTLNITVNAVNDTPVIITQYSDLAIAENNGTTNYELNVSDADGDSLNITVDSNDTSILTVNPNWTNSVLQANYDGITLDFNLTTETNASGVVQVTITVADNDVNTTQSFDVNVTQVQGDIIWKGKTYKEVVSSVTGKTWLDRNLGATKVCLGTNDYACFGDYYQWGRKKNGHEYYNRIINGSNPISVTKAGTVDTGTKFIIIGGTLADWSTESSTARKAKWDATDGSSICPVNYKVPSSAELVAETKVFSNPSRLVSSGQFYSGNTLKVPVAGYRKNTDGKLDNVNALYLWTSTINYGFSNYFGDTGYGMGANGTKRAEGMPVRCIKN